MPAVVLDVRGPYVPVGIVGLIERHLHPAGSVQVEEHLRGVLRIGYPELDLSFALLGYEVQIDVGSEVVEVDLPGLLSAVADMVLGLHYEDVFAIGVSCRVDVYLVESGGRIYVDVHGRSVNRIEPHQDRVQGQLVVTIGLHGDRSCQMVPDPWSYYIECGVGVVEVHREGPGGNVAGLVRRPELYAVLAILVIGRLDDVGCAHIDRYPTAIVKIELDARLVCVRCRDIQVDYSR